MSNSQLGGFCDADEPEELVDPAGIAEHVLPDQHARHERHDVGQEEEDPEQAPAAEMAAVQGKGQRERNDDHDGQPEEGEPERDRQRRPGLAVAHQPGVVVQADEPQRLLLG